MCSSRMKELIFYFIPKFSSLICNIMHHCMHPDLKYNNYFDYNNQLLKSVYMYVFFLICSIGSCSISVRKCCTCSRFNLSVTSETCILYLHWHHVTNLVPNIWHWDDLGNYALVLTAKYLSLCFYFYFLNGYLCLSGFLQLAPRISDCYRTQTLKYVSIIVLLLVLPFRSGYETTNSVDLVVGRNRTVAGFHTHKANQCVKP